MFGALGGALGLKGASMALDCGKLDGRLRAVLKGRMGGGIRLSLSGVFPYPIAKGGLSANCLRLIGVSC